MKAMFFVFDIFYFLACLIYVPLLILRGKWHGGLFLRLGGALQGIDFSQERRKNVWVHAVSVGEVNAIAPLMEKLLGASSRFNVYLTVTTATGHELACKKWGKVLAVVWAPLDFSWVVCRYIRHLRPDVYVVAETEVWPNLIHALSARRVPIIVINGRISSRAYPRYLQLRPFLRRRFESIQRVCVQSERDRERFQTLGARPENISVIGNLKFDQSIAAERLRREDFNIAPADLLWVAGSTHPQEEEALLKIYKQLKAEFPSLRLIIAPRHIERSEELKKTIQAMGLENIVVIDQIGKLCAIYNLADVVFVGKSLLPPGGGQNVIEPAFFAKPIVVGPCTQNFLDVMEQFHAEKAIMTVENEGQLLEALRKFLGDERMRQSLGKKAKAVVKEHQGATHKTYQAIEELLHVS